MEYNCRQGRLNVVLEDCPTRLSFNLSDKCCKTGTDYEFASAITVTREYSNVVHQYDPIDPSCITCSQWDFKVSLDTTLFTSVVGTVKYYSASPFTQGNLIFTDNITTLNWFNTNQSQENCQYMNYYIVVNAVFTNAQGQTFELTTGMSSIGQFCVNEQMALLSTTTDNDIPLFTCTDGAVSIPLELSSGFYTVTGEIEGCFIANCDKLECQVQDKIMSLINPQCYGCNNKKDIEKAWDIYMKYQMLLADCDDCCAKCYLYHSLMDDLEGCTTC